MAAPLGVPLADAVSAATAVPAWVVRRPSLGALRPGTDADIVLLDDAREVKRRSTSTSAPFTTSVL